MRTVRRGIVVVVLTAMFVVGVASVASAQAPPPQQPQQLDPQTQQKIIDTFNRADPGTPDNYLLWLKAIAFAVVCATIAIMLVVVLFALVSAQWRRVRSAHPLRS
jgi:hypothetical protein